MTELLADMALESQAATLLAMDLASRFGSASAMDIAWRRVMTPVAKFWNCKRAVALTGEAMEVFGGNGYVETGPMGRLFREAPVNSIWEGSGNVMCLDVLRAISRNPGDARLVLDCLQEVATQAPPVLAQVSKLRDAIVQLPDVLEREARRFTQRLALVSQACLMLQHASADESAAFVGSRFDPDWGPVAGVVSGTSKPAALLRAAWA
jgi:putative acyl-CoA dehydrogenase